MGKSLDQLQNERAMQEAKGTKVDPKDIELATRMGIQLMTEGEGLQQIRQAINQSQDPAQVIGQFLAQIMAQLATKLQDEFKVDPKIFLAKGGWLENMLDYIEKKLGLPSEFSDQIFSQTVEVIKAAAQHPPAPNDALGPDGGQPGQATPPQPQQGQPLDQTEEQP